MLDKETLKGLEHLINTSNDLTDIDLSIAILVHNMGPDYDRGIANLLVLAIEKRKLIQ